MTEIIRNKWCDDLEDLLQCPVCMTRPKANIYQCIEGHLICEDCKPQLAICPSCTNRWSSARIRLAEDLCSKLDDIKLSLIDPESEINKLLIPDRASVASQTEIEGEDERAEPPARPNDHKGLYPCRVTGCSVNLDYNALVKHFQTDHHTQYIELSVDESQGFEHSWSIDFVEQMTFDRVFVVPGMGTFVLKVSSDIFGNLAGFLLMVHNDIVAREYMFHLEIACCKEHPGVNYTGKIVSCRTCAIELREESLQVNCVDMKKMIEHRKNLICSVLLFQE